MSGKQARIAALVRGVSRTTVHKDAFKGTAVYGALQQLSFAQLSEGNFGWGTRLHLAPSDKIDVEAAFQAVYNAAQGLHVEGDTIQAIAAKIAGNNLTPGWCWVMCAAGLYSRGPTARNGNRAESVIPDGVISFSAEAKEAVQSLWATRTRSSDPAPAPEKCLIWHLSGYTSVMVGNEALQGVAAPDYTNVFTGLAYVVAPIVGVLSTKGVEITAARGTDHATVLAAGPKGTNQILLDLGAKADIKAGGLYVSSGTGWRWDRFGTRSCLPILPANLAVKAMNLPYAKPKKDPAGTLVPAPTYFDILLEWKGDAWTKHDWGKAPDGTDYTPTQAAQAYIKARQINPEIADALKKDVSVYLAAAKRQVLHDSDFEDGKINGRDISAFTETRT